MCPGQFLLLKVPVSGFNSNRKEGAFETTIMVLQTETRWLNIKQAAHNRDELMSPSSIFRPVTQVAATGLS